MKKPKKHVHEWRLRIVHTNIPYGIVTEARASCFYCGAQLIGPVIEARLNRYERLKVKVKK